MVTPVVLMWLKPIPKVSPAFSDNAQTCIAPCPHWRVHVNVTNTVSAEDCLIAAGTGRNLISVVQGEEYTVCDM